MRSDHKIPLAPCTQSSRGAVLVIITLLIVAIFGFMALAIDFNLASASKEQAQHFARLSALAALEQYTSSAGTKSHALSMTDALARARKVAETNYLLSNPTAADKPQLHTAGGGAGALLEPGIWALDSTACPSKACFISWATADTYFDGTQKRYAQPNAMRVNGALIPAGIKSKVFSGALMAGATINSDIGAIATIVPRRGCFLVDNSASMTRQTHLDGDSEFGFFLRDQNLEPDGITPAPESLHDVVWAGMSPGPRPAGAVDPKEHYQNEYVWKKTLGDSAYSIGFDTLPDTSVYPYSVYHPDPTAVGNEKYKSVDSRGPAPDGAWYRVDRFRDPASPSLYQGPEPLRSIFAGLNSALTAFRNRRVAGDKACLIFYDQDIPWPRVVKLTSNFNYLLAMTDSSAGTPDPMTADTGAATPGVLTDDVYKAAGDFTPPVSGINLLVRHGLFPGVLGNTNLYLALTEASTQLRSAESGQVPASSFIVLIGDSLANCQNCLAPHDSDANCTAKGAGCQEKYEFYSQAMSELGTLVNGTGGLRERGIPLHFIGVGPSIAPHTVDIAKPGTVPAQCYTDKEWRLFINNGGNPYGFVYNDASGDTKVNFEGRSTANPFYWGNRVMYKFAVDTQGLWGPIRPPRAYTDSNGNGIVDPGECPATACAGVDPDLVTVGTQRLRVRDPLCRSESQQVADYMADIMGENPYTIVRVDSGLGG